MPPFLGSDFALEQVRQLSVAALRVKYTQYPRALDEDNGDDALNPENYTLVGPQENYVVGAATVDGDRQSIDLYLAAPLDLGTWQLHAENVVEDSSEALMPPTTLPFLVTFTLTEDPLSHGAQNDETENILRKYLNPALKGRGWNSMIAGVSAGDQLNWNNARLAFSQLFLSSATGIYLDRRASDEGIERPKGVNMSDALFRRLALVEKTNKLTQLAVLEVLEVFYGRDTVRAYSDSAAELFALQDDDDLKILLDERTLVTVSFDRAHFARIGRATAQEVAAVITRSIREQGNQGFAVSMTNPDTDEIFVRIYSGTLGLTSSVRVVGGRGNTQLLFPTSLFAQVGVSPFATWDIELSPDTQGNLRFTMTAGTEYDLFQVQEGDLAYIYGDEFEPSNTNGTFQIKAVSITYPGPVQWFEIENPLGEEALGVIQVQFEDLMFFRPTRKTIYDNPRHVIVCENDDHLDVVIPATTEVVDRGPGLAAYLNGQDALAGVDFELIRSGNGVVSIDVDVAHGLQVGDQIFIDGVLPTGEVPSTIAGTPSEDYVADEADGQTDASIQSTVSEAHTYEGVYQKVLRLPGGELMLVGGQTQVDSVTATRIQDVTIFSKVSESVLGNGGRQQDYHWQKFGPIMPPSIGAGLIQWLKGDAGVTLVSGNRLSAWADQSGLGQDVLQATAGHQPYQLGDDIDGILGVSFGTAGDANKHMITAGDLLDRNGATMNASHARTVMVVTRPSFDPAYGRTGGEMWNQSTWRALFELRSDFVANGAYGWMRVAGDYGNALQFTPVTGGAGGPYDGVAIVVTSASPGFPTLAYSINNVSTTLTPANMYGVPGGAAGAVLSNLSIAYLGSIVEVLVWDYELTGADLTAAYVYLASRYPSLGL